MRLGPPKKGEVRSKLTLVTVKLDASTLEHLRELEAALAAKEGGAPGDTGYRSDAIRTAIHWAHERLKQSEKERA